MDTKTIIWIIVAVIVVAVIVALLARRSSARRVEAQRAKAAGIREEAREHDRELRNREAQAEETEARARAARAEADRKAAEAKRLQAEAESHGEGVEEVREVRDQHLRRADEMDPDVEADGDRRGDHDEQDRGPRGRAGEELRDEQRRGEYRRD